jgi:uncharacterized protein (TIGR00369 family)
MTDRYSAPPAGLGVVDPRIATSMTGLAFLRGMLEGQFPAPPFTRWCRVIGVLAEEGRVVFEGDPTADMLNPLGTVHGGWTAGILDTVMACAVHSTLKAGEAYTTVEYKVHCVRPVMPGMGTLRAEGTIVSRGRRVATSEGKLTDARGRLIAHGTETCLVMPVTDMMGG